MGHDLGRLADATPYLLAERDRLVFFWCRWPLDAPLRVALPDAATPGERALLERALRAWERAIPGLAFALGDGEAHDGEAQIRIRLAASAGEGAHTAARCRVERPLGDGSAVRARLVAADVAWRRAEHDAWGRPLALGDAEKLASALHEIGHALGLQGHARRGATVMRLEPDAVRRVARRLLAGEPLREPAVAALYRVPSGSVVARRALSPGASAGLAPGTGALRVQLGDRGARVVREADGELAYFLANPAELFAGTLEFEESIFR